MADTELLKYHRSSRSGSPSHQIILYTHLLDLVELSFDSGDAILSVDESRPRQSASAVIAEFDGKSDVRIVVPKGSLLKSCGFAEVFGVPGLCAFLCRCANMMVMSVGTFIG